MATLTSVFNHLVLPVKLPERQDQDLQSISEDILKRLQEACIYLRSVSGEQQAEVWACLERCLQRCHGIGCKDLGGRNLLQDWSNLQAGDFLILRIAEQNAALLIRRDSRNNQEVVVFEIFETSPSTQAVLAADNALQWDFPGRAVEIPLEIFRKSSFQEPLAFFLEQAAQESLPQFAARAVKAGVSVKEERNTCDPTLLTEFLMPLLEANGQSVSPTLIRKRVRDDVQIHNASLPWRRDPAWLVLRVTVQRHLCLALGDEHGRACYKFLICALLANFLGDCVGRLPPESTLTLRGKLCRRLAKLELDKAQVSKATAAHYETLLASVGAHCEKIIANATSQVEKAWDHFKNSTTRHIPLLPLSAPKESLKLSLPTSGDYLQGLLVQSTPVLKRSVEDFALPPLSNTPIEKAMKMARRYFKLAELENSVMDDETMPLLSRGDPYSAKAELANELIATAHSLAASKPDQMSSIILHVFELWVAMDKHATRTCPLLLDYHPVFTAEILDVLLLPTEPEMRRLQAVQLHLRERDLKCSHKPLTIFSEKKGSFAARYLASDDGQQLRLLQRRIEEASTTSRNAKIDQWEKACQKYDHHSEVISNNVCVCSFYSDGSKNIRGCERCYHSRSRKRMRIKVHEDYLPANHAQKAAVVFEMSMPLWFEAYRAVTWKIICELGSPQAPSKKNPQMHLRDYSPLQPFLKRKTAGISLASSTKSFLQTHYKGVRMKADRESVILPQGLSFLYYDNRSQTWVADFKNPVTFVHLCGCRIPQSLSPALGEAPDHPPQWKDGPSSFETIASQTKCPPDTSLHEFTALQRVLAGSNRRWMTMLVELGSSNLDFSTEETMHLFSDLAVQAGQSQNTANVLRDSHVVFRDSAFCRRLGEQIEKRLSMIQSNWRESNIMELLITLILRLHELSDGRDDGRASILLTTARTITLDWISQLRQEVWMATEADKAMRMQSYAVSAALLCRRTFTFFVSTERTMTGGELCSFVEASVALQEYLVVDLANAPLSLESKLMRDMKMAYQIRSVLRRSVLESPESISQALRKVLLQPGDSVAQDFSRWGFLPSPHDWWIVSFMSSKENDCVVRQVVHYDILEGHLMVEGMSLGQLPPEIRESEEVNDLFGNQHLRCFPSPRGGMSYSLVGIIYGHKVHFGLRHGKVVIHASSNRGLFEYIPRAVFGHDLPCDLVDNCVHWLDRHSGMLHIRRKPVIWKTRHGDWTLDLRTRQAQRRGCLLVDPQSNICRTIQDIFADFEEPRRVTVVQTARHTLSVRLKALELSFHVNQKNLLQCHELRAEIDPNQDAGTLYGLKSMIVLQDVANSDRRSLITRLGSISYSRQGMHVAVRVTGIESYGRFAIDNVLGRLSCPPEPRLLYSKALFHAATSFALPDPLTGRTGGEEAVRALSSGYCQPWTPLDSHCQSILQEIRSLSPKRDYYPRDKKALQTVQWNDRLTATIQHDCYGRLVMHILHKSNQLCKFNSRPSCGGNDAAEQDKDNCRGHLQRRAEIRRMLYDRNCFDTSSLFSECNLVYEPRDRHAISLRAKHVYQTVKLIRRQPFTTWPTASLTNILKTLPGNVIGRFKDPFESLPGSLSGLIEDDIAGQWGCLVNFCRTAQPDASYKVMFRLGLLAFSGKSAMEAIRILCAMSKLQELRDLEPPSEPSDFVGFKTYRPPTLGLLEKLIHPQTSSEDTPEKREGRYLAEHLLAQWPCHQPSAESLDADFLDISEAMERVGRKWTRLYNNMQLLQYVNKVQEVLDRHSGQEEGCEPMVWQSSRQCSYEPSRSSVVPSLSLELVHKQVPKPCDMLSSLPFQHQLCRSANLVNKETEPLGLTKEMTELDGILRSFVESPKLSWQLYGEDLRQSLEALRDDSSYDRPHIAPPDAENVTKMIQKTRAVVGSLLNQIAESLSAGDPRAKWLQFGNLWPAITTTTTLELLRSSVNPQFGDGMKELIVSYGVSVTALQWLLRVKHEQLMANTDKLLEECREKPHENWQPLDFPDWLLFEIESNLLIRQEQIDVAKAIISPSSQANAVLQLNMGKGKTSCIVPMALAVLADSTQLCRLIVPKALLAQTAQILQARLGGLLGREIKHIPFSRRTPTTVDMLELYSKLHEEALAQQGIILAIPEHILSYKLSGLQRLADTKLGEARRMVDFQSWLTQNCRDVLDESDFSLAVKTQLIYPSGQLVPVDGHPDRWTIAQTLLSLVQDSLPDLCHRFPRGIEVVQRLNGYPMIHILYAEIENSLSRRLTEAICNGRTSLLQLPGSLSTIARQEVRKVLSEETPNSAMFERVLRLFPSNSPAVKRLLVVRGLLANRILFLCLKKRWNVQYGLHPKRDPIAVPFDAKGVPSENAEFGHPDVAILCTCLAFYYSGVSVKQFREGLGHVLKSDDAASQYDHWTAGCNSLPETLRHWNLVNIDDSGQVEELWRHLRHSQNVLNHYMNVFVFPVHARQFTVKLQTSGWDLPLFLADDKNQRARTTGFSGTNDNRRLLPLTIKQDDLQQLRQTNAEVLTYLLHDRNRSYDVAAGRSGARLTEEELLKKLSKNKIRVLVDAGAYVLEMDNETLVKKWLEEDTDAPAAVFFRNDNKAWVQYRGDKIAVPLLATPFADNLDKCLVYLDEAHTRGTDLKLPRKARGALTLALGQTKDHTVQAAMRLRQLATTQSVVFIAPPEVHQSILDICNKKHGQQVDSADVVHWLLEQTCQANQQLQGLFLSQGTEFCRRTMAALDNPNFATSEIHRHAILRAIKATERLTLDQLYGMTSRAPRQDLQNVSHASLRTIVDELAKQRQSLGSGYAHIESSVMEEVEQEREVEYQVEEVREVQEPLHYEPLTFLGLQPAVRSFAETGILECQSGYKQVFSALACTNLGQKHGLCKTESRLFVTTDFIRTIWLGSEVLDAEFLRPVEWVLWSPSTQTALVVIPEEAELLIPLMRERKEARAHLIAYITAVTKNVLQTKGLSYYALPSLGEHAAFPDWLSIELGILAARLYFDFAEYQPLKEYLGLADDTPQDIGDASGKETPETSTETSVGTPADLIPFLLDWLTIRRKGQDILHTPMGYICQGRPLQASHPFFKHTGPVARIVTGSSGDEEAVGVEEDEEDSDLDHVHGSDGE